MSRPGPRLDRTETITRVIGRPALRTATTASALLGAIPTTIRPSTTGITPATAAVARIKNAMAAALSTAHSVRGSTQKTRLRCAGGSCLIQPRSSHLGSPVPGSACREASAFEITTCERTRGVPDQTVIGGQSRLLTGTPHWFLPAAGQARQPVARSMQAGDLILLAARLSRPSPPNPGHAVARSLREPGHVGRGQGLAATRATGEEQGTSRAAAPPSAQPCASRPSHRLAGQRRIQPSALDIQRTRPQPRRAHRVDMPGRLPGAPELVGAVVALPDPCRNKQSWPVRLERPSWRSAVPA